MAGRAEVQQGVRWGQDVAAPTGYGRGASAPLPDCFSRELTPDRHAQATRDAALRLLKDLVENQFPCFVGEEGGVFELVLQLRENPSRSVRHDSPLSTEDSGTNPLRRPTLKSIAATELIANSFASRLEPVYGLGALKPALSTYLAASSPPCAGSFALGLRLLGGFYEQLPGEVLEDVLPQSAAIVQQVCSRLRSRRRSSDRHTD